jgi:myo-inositol 2-dehydrogenase/D-chiro-inositol 1-dehydrogenase
MRRFNSAHIEMREEIKQKKIGIPLMIQAMHRNPYLLNPSSEIFEIMNDSAIHSIDFFQWLLEDSFSSVRVFQPPLHPNKQAYENPFLIVFETNRGVLISSELFLNCKYGFDSGCEVIGTEGTLTVKPLKQIKKKLVHHNGENQRWYGRYEKAFQQELQYWINGIKGNAISGPSAWDGYKATLVAKACAVATELNGEKVTIRVEDTPSFYLNR